MNDALRSWPFSSYAIRSSSAPPTPCATPPWIWPSTIIGLISRAAVVDDGVLEDRDLRGLGIGLDDHRVHPGGERRPLRAVEVAALEPGLVVLGDRRLAGVADGELGRRLGRLVEGVAQRVRQHRDGAEVDRGGAVGRPLHRHDAVDDLEVVLGRLERLGRDPQHLLPRSQRGEVDGRPAHHRGPRRERAHGVGHPAGVAGDHLDPVERHARARRPRSARTPSRGPAPGSSVRSRP